MVVVVVVVVMMMMKEREQEHRGAASRAVACDGVVNMTTKTKTATKRLKHS